MRLERAEGLGETFKERIRISNGRRVKSYPHIETIVISKCAYVHWTTEAGAERIAPFDDCVDNASLAAQARKCGGGKVDGVGLCVHGRYEKTGW